MKRRVRDLTVTAVTYLPHLARKRLGNTALALGHLLTPPGCQDRSCCWSEGPFTISGIEFCNPLDVDDLDLGHRDGRRP